MAAWSKGMIMLMSKYRYFTWLQHNSETGNTLYFFAFWVIVTADQRIKIKKLLWSNTAGLFWTVVVAEEKPAKMVPLWRSVPSVSRCLTCRTSPVVNRYLFFLFYPILCENLGPSTNFDSLGSSSPVWYYAWCSVVSCQNWSSFTCKVQISCLIIAEKIVCVCSFTSKWAISGFTSWNCKGGWSISTKCSGMWN